MDTQFDAVKAWNKIRARLDTFSVESMCQRLCLDTKSVDGHVGPMVCPRWACRSTRVFTVSKGWACPTCGAMGGGAAVLTARMAGWLYDVPTDGADIVRDFSRVAMEALFSGCIDCDDAEWIAFYQGLPGFDDWSATTRGIFEGDDRQRAIKALAVRCAIAGWSGAETARVLHSHNLCVCRPPLSANEIADVLIKAAGAKS